jgi:4a-hydroxytetrahydrobiopterin dehydratase
MPVPSLLSDGQVDAALAELPGFRREAGTLRCGYRLPDFASAVALTVHVAGAAEEMRHHPDWSVRYTRVDFTLGTHDAGGITALDLALARRIVLLAQAARATVL